MAASVSGGGHLLDTFPSLLVTSPTGNCANGEIHVVFILRVNLRIGKL